MITYMKGDIFNSTCHALVCPVNTVGVMGAGLAWEFKTRFPHYYWEYKNDCKDGKLQIGKVTMYSTKPEHYKGMDRAPYFIVSFPTKSHWTIPSYYKDIESGMIDLCEKNKTWGISSIAFPKLGCGLGGLDWELVKQLIESFESNMTDFERIEIYE